MSYCRWSEGDVYMYEAERGIVCMCCSLEPSDNFGRVDVTLDTPQEALEHLEQHRDAGHVVPDCAFDQLRAEMMP